jgi:glycosyltransferase involved in cell wall biosynthesis
MSTNERFQLYHAVRSLPVPRARLFRFIEIGSYAGASLYLICAALQRMGIAFQAVAVEPGGQPQFKEVVRRFRDHVIHLPLFSHDAVGRLAQMLDKDNLPGLILVDGDHSYRGVRQDILDFYPLLAPGGIMLFHDFLPPLDDRNRESIHAHHANTEPGIRQACQELMEGHYGLKPLALPLLYPADPTQTQAHLPIIPGVFSTLRAYGKAAGGRAPAIAGRMRVVHLCALDQGGAAKAAFRLHQGLLQAGVDSSILAMIKKSRDPSVRVVPPDTSITDQNAWEAYDGDQQRWGRISARFDALLERFPQRSPNLELFSDTSADVDLGRIREVRDADVVHLHWVVGMLDYAKMTDVLAGKKVVWTLHDMNPFTGGCHYSDGCLKYRQSCGACPQLGSADCGDVSAVFLAQKDRFFKTIRPQIVSPTQWLAEGARASTVLKGHPTCCIPNGLPLEVFRPHRGAELRRRIGGEKNERILLAGADNLSNPRKGYPYLRDAIHRLTRRSADRISLATFGTIPGGFDLGLPCRHIPFGYVSREDQLAMIYGMADVLVIPSIEDNLPNTGIEALACGLPIAAFAAGGIPEIVRHQVNGCLARPRDASALSDAIEWCLANSSREEIRDGCRQQALKSYSLEDLTRSYLSLYDSSRAL